MVLAINVFLWTLIVVSNVFGDDDEACVELFNINNMGHGCCENFASMKQYGGEITSCLSDTEGIPTCDQFKCILEKKNMLKGDKPDEDAVRKQFEVIAKDYPDEKSVLERVQSECLDGKYMEYPPEEGCPAFKYFICIYVNAHLGCTKWKSNDVCTKMSDNAKKCKALVDN